MLSKNPQTGKPDKKLIFEIEGGLEAEAQGLLKNLRRTKNPAVDLDFQAKTISGETFFLDYKEMIDFNSLLDQGIDISHFPSHENVAFNMGKDNIQQKQRFIGLNNGSTCSEDVLHLYNFRNIRNTEEIPVLIQAGSTDGIIFLNGP